MNIYIGIDPGQKGGVCAIDRDMKIVEMFAMPKDPLDLFVFLRMHRKKIARVCIEKSHACRPGQSTNASFSYGYGYGLIIGCLIYNYIPYKTIPPKTWQKLMICTKRHKDDPKKRALISANKVFKKRSDFWLATKRSTKPHDGMIDAALIAAYCLKN